MRPCLACKLKKTEGHTCQPKPVLYKELSKRLKRKMPKITAEMVMAWTA